MATERLTIEEQLHINECEVAALDDAALSDAIQLSPRVKPMATKRLTDAELDFLESASHAPNSPEWRRAGTRRIMQRALAELLDYRAGQLAPEGCVVVREEDLRALIADATSRLMDEKYDSDQFASEWLAHFGLGEVPDGTK